MNDHYCDVIGCPAPARWVWSGRLEEETGNYLCATHWQELKGRQPARAVMYSPLGALQPEATSIPHKAIIRVLEHDPQPVSDRN